MFESAILAGASKGILVETRRGTSIPNVQDPVPSAQAINLSGYVRRVFGQRWLQRKPPTGY